MPSRKTICFFIFVKTCTVSLIVFFSTAYFLRVKSAFDTSVVLPYPQTTVVVEIPLLEAAAIGQNSRIKDLIHNGASTNVADQDGNSPLIFALWNGAYPANQEAVEILLQNQAHTRHRNRAGQAVVQHVVKLDDKELRVKMIGKIIKFGGQLGDMDLKGFDVLQKNIETYDTMITEMILDRWGKFITPDMMARAKNRALEYNLRDVLDVLAKGPRKIIQDAHWNPMAIDSRTGLSDLHCAVINDNKPLVTTIVRNKRGNPNQASEDEYGMRPLHYAVLHYNPSMVKELVQLGADVRKSNKQGNLPHHMVAWLNDINSAKDSIDALLEKNPTLIDAQNNKGNTLLHILIYNNNQGLVNHILQTYAPRITIKNSDDESCTQLAARLGREALLRR
jgi:ankyrin repeat protein